MGIKGFLKSIDNGRVVSAIQAAEARTHGEVRVHVTSRNVDDAEKAAAAQFDELEMAATKDRCGVLIYVAPASRRFAIIGDTGIHERCGPEFWKEIAAAMSEDFRGGRFTEGIVSGVARAGEALARHFPREAGRPDTNELPDQVSED